MEYRDNLNNGKNNLNGEESLNNPQLGFYNYNRFIMLSRVMNNTSCCNLNNGNMLREVMVKIGLEEGVIVEVLLDSSTTGLMMSWEFIKKLRFKLKKIERPIYVRNVNSSFNMKRAIKYRVEANIYYQRHRKRTEINIIRGQKWSVILEML